MNKRQALREAAAHLRNLAIVEQGRWSRPDTLSWHSPADKKRMAAAHGELARRLDALASGRKQKPPPPPDPNQVALFE